MAKIKPKGYKGKVYKVAPKGKGTHKLEAKWKRILEDMKKPSNKKGFWGRKYRV